MHRVDIHICEIVQESMKHWCTTLTTNGENLADIQIKCGIFQGDALSPLLFCVALNPLSNIMHNTGYGYTLKSGFKVSHLLYMDDLKLYSKKEREVNSMINTVRIFSEDIGMKCSLTSVQGLSLKEEKLRPLMA